MSKDIEIQSIHQKCTSYFKSGQTRPIEHRSQNLERLQHAIQNFQERLLKALEEDFGKPRVEAYISEIGYVLEDIRRTVKALPRWARPQNKATPLMLFPAKSAVYFEPRGVCLIIAPWNYPFQLLITPLVGALAAGNCAVLKPSEMAPRTASVIGEMLASVFKSDLVAFVEGGAETTKLLLEKKWDHIFFTGSTRVGKIVMKAAAEHLTPVTLELGGKSPCVLDREIPLERALRRVIWGKFFNAGQTCVAPDYLFVPKEQQNDVVSLAKKTIAEFFGSNPVESSSFARVVNEGNYQRLKSLLGEGKILVGGDCRDAERFISPTLIQPSTLDSSLMQDEIFGPILPLLSYDKIDEAFDFISGRPKPLAFYLFTKDSMMAERALDQCSFGGACINDTLMHLSNHELPFGGVGDSGMGAYHGRYSFETFSHRKGVLKNTLNFEVELRYPPYTDDRLRMMQFAQGI